MNNCYVEWFEGKEKRRLKADKYLQSEMMVNFLICLEFEAWIHVTDEELN